MMIRYNARTVEACAQLVDRHKVDASFDDSQAGTMERNALLSNVAAEIRALAVAPNGYVVVSKADLRQVLLFEEANPTDIMQATKRLAAAVAAK